MFSVNRLNKIKQKTKEQYIEDVLVERVMVQKKIEQYKNI